jgi:REP element-mobilizing transposase RayT
MARPLRIEFAGALYHVTSRGNRKQLIFPTSKDGESFLEVLAGVVERYGWLCHAYCLMHNHYHLLIETPEPNLSQGMRQLNGVFTQKYNRRHDLAGHVFQGRYKAIVVEKDSHLLEVCRYVALNPVRAAMVKRPEQWRWSSYREMVGENGTSPFLTSDWLLSRFGERRQDAQNAYRTFVEDGIEGETPFKKLAGGLILGSADFVARCRNGIGSTDTLKEVPRVQRHVGRPSLEEILHVIDSKNKQARNAAIITACVDYGYSQQEVATALSIHPSTVSLVAHKGVRS